MKLNIHIASAVLCTALLASFCNAFPPYWDREAFLEQLQQEEHVGADVEIPNREPGTCIFSCPPGLAIFVTNDNEETIRRSQRSIIEYQSPCTFRPSISINGTMYDVILFCYTKCPELSILNGVVEYHGIDNQLEPRDPDTTATYSCSGDYKLEGEGTRKCGREGEWLGEEPKCILQCPELEDIANGRVYLTGRDPGAIAIYFCMEGYDLNGTETRTCNPDATWSDQEPTCQPSKPLDEPPRCKELKQSDIPNNVPEAKRQLKNARNYQQILFTPYYNRRIEGNRFEGSKAYLTCVKGWKLLEGTPAVQTCILVNGELVWTPAGTCVYHYSYTWPRYG